MTKRTAYATPVPSARAEPLRGAIVFAVPDYAPSVGGTSRHVALLARGLRARGHPVLVVTRRRHRSWQRRDVVDGVQVRRIGLAGRSRFSERHALLMLAVFLAVQRARIAVLSTVMWPDSTLAARAAGVLGRTINVWAIRGEIDTTLELRGSRRRRLLVEFRRAALRRCTNVVLNRSMADELARHVLGSAVLVPVPVDLEEFRPPTQAERRRARDDLGLDGEFTIAYVGHLQRRKAVDRLIRAAGLLAAEGRGVRLLVVGGSRGAGDDTEGELRSVVARENLANVVRFCGIAGDPRPYLWAADAFVLPSFREGMPNSLLEAMACGIPCIAPASAGGDELLDDGAGVIPRSNEPAQLADALRQVADDAAYRASMSAAGRRRASEFGVDRVVARFEEVCAEVARR